MKTVVIAVVLVIINLAAFVAVAAAYYRKGLRRGRGEYLETLQRLGSVVPRAGGLDD